MEYFHKIVDRSAGQPLFYGVKEGNLLLNLYFRYIESFSLFK